MSLLKVKMLLLCFVVISRSWSTATAVTDNVHEFAESTTVSPATRGYTSDNTQPEKSVIWAKPIHLVCHYNHSDHVLHIRWYKVFSTGSVRLLKQKDVLITNDTDETVWNVAKVLLSHVRDICDNLYICSVCAEVGHIVSNCSVSEERIDSLFHWAETNKKIFLAPKSSAHVKHSGAFVVIIMYAIGFLIY